MVEIIIVLSITTLLFYISSTIYVNIRSYTGFEIAKLNIIQSIRNAQSNSQKTKNDSAWGIKISADSVTVFEGNSYASRNTGSDKVLDFSSGIVTSGPSEIVFDKITGSTDDIGTIIISGYNFTNQIHINEKGTLTY